MIQSERETDRHARNSLALHRRAPARSFARQEKALSRQSRNWHWVAIYATSIALLTGTMCQSPLAQQSGAHLPNGASAINEIYGDWVVDCRIVEAQKHCGLSQAQGNSQTGQRLFVIELRSPRDGKADGSVLMPFGVSLERGASLKLDDKDFGRPLRFTTCMPQGCLLPISLSVGSADPIRKASKLTVTSVSQANGEAISFAISLNGFGAAVERIVQLAR